MKCLNLHQQKVQIVVSKKEYDKKYYSENKQKRKTQVKQNSAKNRDKERARHIKKYYGMEWNKYCSMYEQQQNSCAICNKFLLPYKINEDTKQVDIAHVDHCHTTLKIRGLLCKDCNDLLGSAKDNVVLLRNAIKYLERGEINDSGDGT